MRSGRNGGQQAVQVAKQDTSVEPEALLRRMDLYTVHRVYVVGCGAKAKQKGGVRLHESGGTDM